MELYLEYPWRILRSLPTFLISLLGYYRRMRVLIPIPILLLLGSVLPGL